MKPIMRDVHGCTSAALGMDAVSGLEKRSYSQVRHT